MILPASWSSAFCKMVHEMNSIRIYDMLYSSLKGDAGMSFISDFENAIEYIEENLTGDST